MSMTQKNQPQSSAKNPITTYAIGVEKADLTSLCAMARMLLMRSLRSGRRRGHVFGCHVQEDLLEAHPHRAHFEEPPSAAHNRRRELAPDIMPRLAVDLEAHDLL